MEKISIHNIQKLTEKDLIGKVICFHTDTVYGIGALFSDETGIKKIYEIKRRSYDKALPVLCASIEQVKSIAIMTDKALEIAKYWPGALTMILKEKDENNTIAVRIPDSKIAINVLNHFGPLRTTSINYSGDKELNDIQEIIDTFGDEIDYIITDMADVSGVPSTIVDLTTEEMKIIRQGCIEL